ncbi:MAG: LLM class flavin-dependent oxidoreductase, partial [Pseudomonadales bacterium]|nr:LLM class flavin-dependent oxidoreductase [Pseudomonadales bacterium]
PAYLMQALSLYRERFKPSAQLQKPYAMAAIPVFAAETEAQARYLMSSVQQQFIALRRGTPGPLKPPIDNIEQHVSALELAGVAEALAEAVVGDPEQVKAGLAAFLARTQVDEVMLSGHIFDPAQRLRSFELAAEACRAL